MSGPSPTFAAARVRLLAPESALYDYLHSLAPQAGPTGEPTFVKGKEPQEVDRRVRAGK
jgi:hypothetical protein